MEYPMCQDHTRSPNRSPSIKLKRTHNVQSSFSECNHLVCNCARRTEHRTDSRTVVRRRTEYTRETKRAKTNDNSRHKNKRKPADDDDVACATAFIQRSSYVCSHVRVFIPGNINIKLIRALWSVDYESTVSTGECFLSA